MALTNNIIQCIKIFISVSGRSEKNCIYLETGLDEGDSINTVLNNFNFKKVISIEIDQIKINKVKERLKENNYYSKILFVHGDSSEKLKEHFDQNVNIIFLDAHGIYSDADSAKISPLEKEIKFLVDKINENQLIIIDDFLKIKNDYLFTDKLDWRSHYRYSNFKRLLHNKKFKLSEFFYDNGTNSYLIITKNKDFKIDIKLSLTNMIFKFFSVKFYIYYGKFLIYRSLKKIIISFTSESFFLKIKNFFITDRS